MPANSGFIPAFARRGEAAGKGTGNFFEAEKVASPQLDSRWSLS